MVDCCDVCWAFCHCCDCSLFFLSTFLICCFARLACYLWFDVCDLLPVVRRFCLVCFLLCVCQLWVLVL